MILRVSVSESGFCVSVCLFLCGWVCVFVCVYQWMCALVVVCLFANLCHIALSVSHCVSVSVCLCVTLLVCMSLYRPYCASINDGVIYSHFQLTTTIVFTWAGIIEHLFSVTQLVQDQNTDRTPMYKQPNCACAWSATKYHNILLSLFCILTLVKYGTSFFY